MIRAFALFVAALVGGLVLIDLYAFDLPVAAVALDGRLSDTQTEAVRLLTGQSGFLVTLTLAIFGGCAAVVFDRARSRKPLRPGGLVALAFVVAFCAYSIFFSHMLSSRLIEMIANDFLALLSPVIVWSFRLQYGALLGAVVAGAAFLLTEVIDRPPDPEA